MKKVLIIIVGLLATGAVAWFIVQQNNEDASLTDNTSTDEVQTTDDLDDAQAASEHLISFTDSGYVPGSIQIEVGETVTFTNNSSNPMWPASDPHPTHDILPEFDPKKAIEPGETYEFTFEEPGDWGFHDHLRPQFQGTISVQ